jgi:predicted nucleotidyltransferase
MSTEYAPEPTTSITSEVAEKVRPIVEAHPRVMGLYLFGSQVRGDAHPGSDVDLGILFEYKYHAPLREIVTLETRFEEALGRKVDLVNVGSCNAFLALDVIRGDRIYERDGVAVDEFDLYVMRRAGDLAPYERERRRMLLSGSAKQ